MRMLMKMDTGELFPWTEILAKRGDMVEALPEEPGMTVDPVADAPKPKRGRKTATEMNGEL